MDVENFVLDIIDPEQGDSDNTENVISVYLPSNAQYFNNLLNPQMLENLLCCAFYQPKYK